MRKRISESCLKDTVKIVELNETVNAESKRMFSLDVWSLFTNAPLLDIID